MAQWLYFSISARVPYYPTPRSVFGALNTHGISVQKLAMDPEIDLRPSCHTWLSKAIPSSDTAIRRIGCIELLGRDVFGKTAFEVEQTMITSIRAYFSMLDTVSILTS